MRRFYTITKPNTARNYLCPTCAPEVLWYARGTWGKVEDDDVGRIFDCGHVFLHEVE